MFPNILLIGGKLKTIVRAVGATLAWQTMYDSTNLPFDYVNFEHWDSSGMSYRSTTADGVAIYGEGSSTSTSVTFQHRDASGSSYRSTNQTGTVYTSTGWEGSPAELDPLGGNVGAENPYPLQTYTTGEGCIGCGILTADEPMYINGQRLTCTLDGMAIGCRQAQSMLESGSAIPAYLTQFQLSPCFQFNLVG